jgi:hypothetical protein
VLTDTENNAVSSYRLKSAARLASKVWKNLVRRRR